MDWTEWQSKIIFGFKVAITALSGWAIKEVLLKIKPTYKSLKDFTIHGKRIEVIEGKIRLLDEKAEVTLLTIQAYCRITNELIFINDEYGQMFFASDCWLAAFGFTNFADAEGFGWMQCVPDADKLKMDDLIARHQKSQGASSGIIVLNHVITGEPVRAKYKSVPIKFGGKLKRTIGILEIIKN
jgi:hypothetical protein